MKIGTWNLDARWTAAHEALLTQEHVDVWLLTEVSPSLSIPGFQHHFSEHRMMRGQHYSAILSRLPLQQLPDPHPASAAAILDGIVYCSSILPRSTCAHDPASPWAGGTSVEEMVRDSINQISQSLNTKSLVWGGDWNQNLVGNWEYVGSSGGRARIECAVTKWDLKVLTASLPHRRAGYHSIDHIAVPSTWKRRKSTRLDATSLSDHDAYIIEAEQHYGCRQRLESHLSCHRRSPLAVA